MSEGFAPDPAEELDEMLGRHPSGLGPPAPPWRRRTRWIWMAAVVTVVAVLAALFSHGLSTDPTLIRSPLLNRPAPDFDLRTLDGTSSLSLRSLRGQVVVVNFWASWCGPCRVEHGALNAAWERYRDQGVVIVGISYQDRPSAGLAFMKELGGDWPVLEDPGSRTALAFGMTGVPETYFIDQSGVIRYKVVSAVTYDQLTDLIGSLLERGGR